MRRTPTRYHVKAADGRELVVPSLDDLHSLYVHGFLADEDLVRSERSPHWIRAGAMNALQTVREERRVPASRVALLVSLVLVLATAAGLLLAG